MALFFQSEGPPEVLILNQDKTYQDQLKRDTFNFKTYFKGILSKSSCYLRKSVIKRMFHVFLMVKKPGNLPVGFGVTINGLIRSKKWCFLQKKIAKKIGQSFT